MPRLQTHELIPAIAQASAALGEPPYPDSVRHRMPPWGLAAAARDSLLYGNEYRSQAVDETALQKLMHKFQIAMDIDDTDVGSKDFSMRLLTRLMYEQLPYQESMFEELARSHAWLVEGLPDIDTRVITEDSLAAMLDGVPIREAIGATFFLQVGAFQNDGAYNPGWLDQPHFTEVLKVYPRTNILKIAGRLTTTPAAFRTAFNDHSVGTATAARFEYNPLMATPFVDMGDGEPVAPATRLIMRTVTPGGLYYAGIAKHGSAFADDLGVLFEHYIGRQLELIEDAKIEPEIVFGKHGGGQKSIDWFVILPHLVILVEVKSSRLGPAARAGEATLVNSLSNTLGGARQQLSRTVSNLADNHPAFNHIPTNRPMLGLIVTAEPFYSGTAYLLNHDDAAISGGRLPDVPIATVSARDIEHLVTHGRDVEPLLLAKMARSVGGVVSLHDIGKKVDAENPILLNAWNAYPWPTGEAHRDGDSSATPSGNG
ncbi:hypothetical protein JT358_10445 [Micrococcales bacterium 31B]|nr:hypothetical protein [Micrococcales bacterium 31B]